GSNSTCNISIPDGLGGIITSICCKQLNDGGHQLGNGRWPFGVDGGDGIRVEPSAPDGGSTAATHGCPSYAQSPELKQRWMH
ncbi:MAG TPA: hypothetical protein VN638_11260, partial [Nitrospiraceae bacterium]|nr:hypothetical protein [Nitrospiraceae bacterium]